MIFNFYCNFAVVGTAYEPLICWTDNIYGPTGLVVGAGCGVIHSVYGDVNGNANIVPVDMVASAIIASAANTIQRGYVNYKPNYICF